MRNRYIFLFDLAAVVIALTGAFVLRFDWFFLRTRSEAWPFLAAALVVKPAVFAGFGLYRRYWKFASTQELNSIAVANAAASLLLAVLVPVGFRIGVIAEFPRSVLFVDFLLTLVLTGGSRFSVRVIAESQRRAQKLVTGAPDRLRRVLVVGAGEAGIVVVREAQKNPQLGFDIVGFLDDDPVKHRKQIAGVPVLGLVATLEHVIQAYRVNEVVIAMPTAPGSVIRMIADTCRSLNVPSKTVPGVFELLGGRVSVSRLRDVEIGDLLKRNPVPDTAGNVKYVTGRRVLVTGAGGSIGSELCRQLAMAGPKVLILLGHGENSVFDMQAELAHVFPGVPVETVIADIRDRARIESVFERRRPEFVFHAAAHKHVPLMEANPEEAVTNNVLGTVNVLDASALVAVERLVFISSDKAVAPSSIMGASKRLAELVVRQAAKRTGRPFMVVRFGNVLGSRGSVVSVFKKQIERGGPLTITHPDMRRYFMSIPEAVHLVLQAAGLGSGGEVFVLNMGQPMAVVDLARDIVRLSGLEPGEISISYSGIRPGEKLVEALWEDGARLEATANADLFSVVEDEPAGAELLLAAVERVSQSQRWMRPDQVASLLTACQGLVGADAPEAGAATRPPELSIVKGAHPSSIR